MNLLKIFRSKPRNLLSLQRTISSDAPSPAPNPQSLSSLFSGATRKPSRSPVSTKPSPQKKTTLSATFAKKHIRNGKLPDKGTKRFEPLEEKEFPSELSPQAALLVGRLIEDGYLKDANFAKGEQLELHKIPPTLYSRHFLKTAAEKFGREHQEIAKWLSGSELKKIALFGCPSTERKTVFAAKRLRAFFRIQEDVVCRGCKLKSSCRFPNKRVTTLDKVVLEDVMRLITVYTLDAVPFQLVITDDLKCSIGALVKEAISLSS